MGEYANPPLPALPDSTQVEVRITGAPQNPETPCRCDKFHAEVTVALMTENADGTGDVVGREVKLQMVCAECGRVGRFDPSTARRSRADGDLAVVVEFTPA